MDIDAEVRATRRQIMEDLIEVSGLNAENLSLMAGIREEVCPPIPDFDVQVVAIDVLLKVIREPDLEQTSEVTCNSFLDYLKKQRS
jgi:hypothetical protein